MIKNADIIQRIKGIYNLENDKQVAGIFNLSPKDFSNRKKRGTLIPLIVEWAVNENVDLDWLIKGQGGIYKGKPPGVNEEQQSGGETELTRLAELYPETGRYTRVLKGVIETDDPDLIATTLEGMAKCIRREEDFYEEELKKTGTTGTAE